MLFITTELNSDLFPLPSNLFFIREEIQNLETFMCCILDILRPVTVFVPVSRVGVAEKKEFCTHRRSKFMRQLQVTDIDFCVCLRNWSISHHAQSLLELSSEPPGV